jgi:hypothetical protein
MAPVVPFVQLALVRVQPDGKGTVSLTLKPLPGVRPANVWLAAPPVVVREASPKLLVNANVPFPPTVFFTTLIDPVGAAVLVLRNVQVVVAPLTTVMAVGVPLSQLELVRVQPEGTVSLTLKLPPAARPVNV